MIFAALALLPGLAVGSFLNVVAARVPAKLSIVDAAPALLPFFNNGPVFGTPGTVAGDVWQRTQLSGDWDGARSRLDDEGMFVDLYSTSSYQDVTEGGLGTGS